MDDLRKFARYFRPYKWSLVIGVVCILASVAIGLVKPGIIRVAVDDLIHGDVSWWSLTRLALIYLGISAVSGVFLFLQRRILIGMSRHVEYDLRQHFYAHLQRQPLSFFHANRTGDLMARATNDLSAVRQLAGPMIMYTLQTVAVVVFVLPLMLRISVRLTLLLLVTMPLVSLIVKYFGQQVHVRFEKIQDFFAQRAARAQENFSGVRVVRAYAQEGAEIEAFNDLNRQYAERSLSLVRIEALMRPLLQFIIGIGYIVIIWYGGWLAINGQISTGQVVEFIFYLGILIWPLIALGYVINLYQRGTASLKRMNAIFAVEPAINDEPGTREQSPIRGRIEFRNLTFAYNEHAGPVLRDINLTIEAGQTVAFVGRTGSGKSTLMNLVPRIVEAPPGTVFIDDVDVREYTLAQLRAAVGYVPQETFLFSETLAENIAFGVERAERAEVEWAAEIAGLGDDVREFPEGFDTLVGEGGIVERGTHDELLAAGGEYADLYERQLLEEELAAS